MSIVVRRGRPVAEPRSRLLRFERPPTVDAVVTAIDRSHSTPDGRHELAHLALDVVVRTSEPMSVPPPWKTAPFGGEVDRTRAQLEPIRSRDALVCSYRREGSIAVTMPASPRTEWAATPERPHPPAAPGPVRVAYAVRWLELGDGCARPAWAAIVAGVMGDVVAALATASDPTSGPVAARTDSVRG